MPHPRRTAYAGLPLAVLLALAGCSDAEPPTDAAPDVSATVTSSPSATPTSKATQPGPSVTADPGDPAPSTPAKPVCEAVAGLRDGAWEGPIALDVESEGGDSEFDDSAGTGSLRVLVEDGKVVTGTWTTRWRSTGRAKTEQAEAEITLTGTIGGKVSGAARQPVLNGTWRVRGTAVVTKPSEHRIPIDESGTRTAKLTPRSTGCDDVIGVFFTSFESKDALVTFTGEGTWKGRRVD